MAQHTHFRKAHHIYSAVAMMVFLSASILTLHNARRSIPVYASSHYSVSPASGSLTIAELGYSSFTETTFNIFTNGYPSDYVYSTITTNGKCEARGNDNNFGTSVSKDIYAPGSSSSVKVRSIDNNSVEGTKTCALTITMTSTDTNFNGEVAIYNISVTDDDATPGISTVKTDGGTLQEGDRDKVYIYKVNTNDLATETIAITATTNGQCEFVSSGGKGGGQEATYSNSTAINISQYSKASSTRTIVAKDDSSVEGTHICTVSHAIATSDSVYAAMSLAPLSLSITDNDTAPTSTSGGSNPGTSPTSSNPTPSSSEPDVATNEQTSESTDDDTPSQEVAVVGLIDAKDGNNDGIEDTKQPHVVVIDNPVTKTATVIEITKNDDPETKDDCTKITNQSISEANKADDSEFQYPFGAYEFSLECSKPGASAEVGILLHNDFADLDLTLQKLTGNGEVNTIEDAQFAPFETQNGTVTKVTYTLVDGGPLDADGEANGVIVDPVAVAQKLAQAETLVEDGNQGSNLVVIIVVTTTLVGAAAGGFYLYSRKMKRNK